jgi:selT/selW/selH-like putative selenoprotein
MLQQKYGAEVELVPGVAGVFDITVDGVLKYSKKQTGRFPTDDEVIATGEP